MFGIDTSCQLDIISEQADLMTVEEGVSNRFFTLVSRRLQSLISAEPVLKIERLRINLQVSEKLRVAEVIYC